MAHGLSSDIEQIDRCSVFFVDQGVAMRPYDHRGFRGSGGTSPQETDPASRLGNWRDANTLMLALPEVVPGAKVDIWGSSSGGRVAPVLAANDRRIRCIIAQVPSVSGLRNGRWMFNVGDLARLERLVYADRVARLHDANPATVPALGTDVSTLRALLPVVSRWYVEAVEASYPTWRNRVHSVQNILSFVSAGWMPYATPTPLMLVVTEKDSRTFLAFQVEVFPTALEPERVIIQPRRSRRSMSTTSSRQRRRLRMVHGQSAGSATGRHGAPFQHPYTGEIRCRCAMPISRPARSIPRRKRS